MKNACLISVSLTALLLGCSSLLASAQTPQTPASQPTLPATTLPGAPAPAPAQPSQLPDSPSASRPQAVNIEPTGPTAVIDTSMGRLTCKLFDTQSPLAVSNFVGLATGTKDWTDPNTGGKVHGRPFYDGTTFHRVIPQFMIQGGDRKGDGSGDAGYYFDNENTPGLDFSVAGRLAMANAGMNTNGAQFFITETPYPDLNGKYTIFGQCDSHSVLMVATIARVDRDTNDKPVSAVTINKVTIVKNGEAVPPEPAVKATSAPATPATEGVSPVAPMPSPK